jgi:lipid-binding SYLF domain-containing protein
MHIRSSIHRIALQLLFVALLLGGATTVARAQAREEARLLNASSVLEELRGSRDDALPQRLLERAYGIAVIPDLTEIAFFAGGRRGHGVLIVRDKQGRFTSPVFVTMTGGSFGWQWGVHSTDIVLVFTTPKGVRGIEGGKMTLGADASVAAGPVGREATASTDASFKAEVYSYSRSRGVFAGLALDGTAITIDDAANADFYQKPNVASEDILSGAVTSNDEASRRFLAAVTSSTTQHAAAQRSASAAGAAGAAPTAPTPENASAPTSTVPTTAPAHGARSFPLADQQPGQEPK